MCAFVSAHTHACLYMRGACSHALTEDVFIKLHMLSMQPGEFACLADGQFTAQLDIAELLLQPPHSPACHFGIVSVVQSLFNLSLSIYILVRAALISSACHTGYCSDSGAIPNEQLDTGEGMFCWPKQLLVSINSAVKTNGGQPKAWTFSLDPWGSLYVHTWFNWSTCVWHSIYIHTHTVSFRSLVTVCFLYTLGFIKLIKSDKDMYNGTKDCYFNINAFEIEKK